MADHVFWSGNPDRLGEGLRLSESPIKYTVAMGTPIGRTVPDSPICFDNLKVGDEVVCPWIFGRVLATVTRLDGETCEAESKHQLHRLHFCKDRKCWCTSSSMAKR